MEGTMDVLERLAIEACEHAEGEDTIPESLINPARQGYMVFSSLKNLVGYFSEEK